MRLARLLCLLLPGGYVLACGGRFEQQVEGDGQPSAGTGVATGATSNIGGSTSQSGSASKAGSVGRGGSTSQAGSSSRAGSTSSGGRVGTGGTGTVGGGVSTAGAGGVCLCDPIGCAPPYREAPNADGCCWHCELDPMLCVKAAHDYESYRSQVIQKYQTLGCMSDSDCGLFFDKNECQAGFCGAVIVKSELMSMTQVLDSYAQMNCSFACPPAPPLPCPLIPAPKCVMSHCQ